MTLYFHGHFTSAAIAKGISPRSLYAQNQLFRSYALGNLRELTRDVAKDPAMLRLSRQRSQRRRRIRTKTSRAS